MDILHAAEKLSLWKFARMLQRRCIWTSAAVHDELPAENREDEPFFHHCQMLQKQYVMKSAAVTDRIFLQSTGLVSDSGTVELYMLSAQQRIEKFASEYWPEHRRERISSFYRRPRLGRNRGGREK